MHDMVKWDIFLIVPLNLMSCSVGLDFLIFTEILKPLPVV